MDRGETMERSHSKSKTCFFQMVFFTQMSLLSIVFLSLFISPKDIGAAILELPCKYRIELVETLDYSEGSGDYSYAINPDGNSQARIGFIDLPSLKLQKSYRVSAEFDISPLAGKLITGVGFTIFNSIIKFFYLRYISY